MHKEPSPGIGTLLAGFWTVGSVLSLHPEGRHCSYPGPDLQEERTPTWSGGGTRLLAVCPQAWLVPWQAPPPQRALAHWLPQIRAGQRNGVPAVPSANLPPGGLVLSWLMVEEPGLQHGPFLSSIVSPTINATKLWDYERHIAFQH